MTTSELLSEIEEALRKTGLSPTMFGKKAVGDPNLVFELREGRRDMRASTMQKVRAFIAEQQGAA
jgi:tRNA-dihydrouridine synthase